MSSVISRMIWRRSSRVSGVRSRTSCSVTARVTRSVRSPVASRLKSSAPSVAMHAWWIRVFSSAYGSCADGSFATSPDGWPASSASARWPFPFEVLSRSWRPIALRLSERGDQTASRRLRLLDREEPLRHLADRLRDVGSLLVEDHRLATVDGKRHGAVPRDLEAHLHPERSLDLVLLHPDLRVGAVEDDLDPLLREREQLERLQREAQVLQRRHVQAREQEQLVGAVERRQHRAVEERRGVDDDRVV